MCFRRSSRHPKNKRKKDGTTQTGIKKPSCCKRCIRKIGKFCCRRIIRCIKKRIFGIPNPALEHYEIAGYNLGSLKSKLKIDNKKSPETLFKNNIRKSKVSLKNVDLIEGFSAKQLKKKFSITGSKQNTLENMVDDYKTGKLSLARLIPNQSKFDARKLDKNQLNKMLQDYETTQKRIKNNADLDADDLKKKFSITGSRGRVLEKMITDYKMGKGSATGLSVKSKFDPHKLNKEQMNDMLKKYEAAQIDRKRISFMEKSQHKLQSIFEGIKNKKFSFTAISRLMR